MKANRTRLLVYGLLAAFLVGLLAPEAQAGDKKRRGTAGADHLLVPPTARTAALGNAMTAGMANASGLEALYSNPAGLALNPGTNAIFSRIEYVADIGVNYFGVAQRFGNNNLAITFTAWDFGDIPLTTETSPEISSLTFSASFITAALSYARQFTDRMAAGVTFKVINESIDDTQATGIAFDAGMNYTVGESGLRLGVSLKNIGPQMSYGGTGMVKLVRLPDQRPNATPNALRLDGADFELPSMLNFGISYTREVGAGAVVNVFGNFRSNSFDQDQFAGGLELGFRNILFVRGGYSMQESDQDLTFYSGTNFGAGLNLDLGGTTLVVDYAYRSTDFFDGVQMFTASVTL
ncbi:PorV/PorQ family protein [Rhodocaloribacter litoris]|uniref:PorV/PorQ family protein n=1 Tax=Rhodocaloribacter litoris TaxID=2558931 RepID=UPI00141D8B9B|nr:PorV/PorQ family protein [Rhodocaloribacter litoris]QXD16747.1 PorV/PorQ family protein [Rhodocaloribacter litoris]